MLRIITSGSLDMGQKISVEGYTVEPEDGMSAENHS